MDGRRRRMLQTLGSLALGSLAGCSEGGSPTESPNSGAAVTETRSDTETRSGETATETEPLPESAKLAPESLGKADKFGLKVAISGDGSTVLVSAIGEGDKFMDPGQAFVFQAAGGEWRQQARFTADDEDHGAAFGHSVALNHDGTTGLVGCLTGGRTEDAISGTVYVVTADDGTWRTETKLKSAVQHHRERFGMAVSLAGDGETALVSSNVSTDDQQYKEGWAQVLTKDGGSWTHVGKFTAEDRKDGDMFGIMADLSADGTTALIGAPENDNAIGENAGAGYVFSPGDGTWTQQAKLVPDEASEYSRIGDTVALSADGSEAFLGDFRYPRPSDEQSGAVHVFGADGTGWRQQATMYPESDGRIDSFGDSLAVSADGSTALVGSAFGGEPSPGNDVAAVHVMERRNGTWHEREKLADVPGRHRGDGFGDRVALSGDASTGVVGAAKDAEVGFFTGAAYVLQL